MLSELAVFLSLILWIIITAIKKRLSKPQPNLNPTVGYYVKMTLHKGNSGQNDTEYKSKGKNRDL